MDGERIAPPDTIARHGRYGSRAASASTSGRAIASPTRQITNTFSRSTRSQISLRVESAARVQHDAVAAEERDRHRPLRVAVHERRERERAGRGWRETLSAICSGAVIGGAAVVPAAQGREEDVFGAPHHALGHAGGAARVEDVEVVGRARARTRRDRRRGLERVLVLDRVELLGDGAGAVVELRRGARASGAREARDATCGPNSAS